jgi:hypothetical protein
LQGIQGQGRSDWIELNGYISSMQSAIFEEFDGDWTNDNLLHNRLNLKLYAGNSVKFIVEARNRLFTGDQVRINPDYSSIVGGDRGWADMSWNMVDENSLILNTTIDRLYLDISGNRFQLNIGRQRINWGQTFVWNPNDIFNAYSYFDVDYIERPGSDAIRLQIYPSFSSTVELAAKIDNNEKLTIAALYRFNRWGYDFQFLTGHVADNDWVFGTGWSGAFGSTSFRGEVSWFQPDNNFADTTGTGLFTVGFDRSFKDNSIAQFQVMYCNNPLDFSSFDSFYTGNLSAKDLAFSELSIFASYSNPVTPLVNIGISAIFYPGLKGFFAGPTADISLGENIDCSIIWQHFNAELAGENIKMNLAFLRMKLSF